MNLLDPEISAVDCPRRLKDEAAQNKTHSFSRCQAIHHMTKLCGLQQTQRSTNTQKVACRFLSPLGEQLSVLLQNPQLILLAPSLP